MGSPNYFPSVWCDYSRDADRLRNAPAICQDGLREQQFLKVRGELLRPSQVDIEGFALLRWGDPAAVLRSDVEISFAKVSAALVLFRDGS